MRTTRCHECGTPTLMRDMFITFDAVGKTLLLCDICCMEVPR